MNNYNIFISIFIYYRLWAEPLREPDTWLEGYRELWEDRFDRLCDYKDQGNGMESWGKALYKEIEAPRVL